MRFVAIIQARMGSSRLPGKVLMPLAGQPVLAHVIRRVAQSNVFDEVAVATSNLPIDDALADVVTRTGYRAVRGDEADVLARYGIAAAATNADAIMRVTADCPLIDPDVLAAMVARFADAVAQGRRCDLVTNARLRTFPRGLDAELFTRQALEIMLEEAKAAPEREHVTPFLYGHPERFHIVDYLGTQDHSALRLTLDTAEDYELLSRIYNAAPAPECLRLPEVLDILGENPEWIKINAGVSQKQL